MHPLLPMSDKPVPHAVVADSRTQISVAELAAPALHRGTPEPHQALQQTDLALSRSRALLDLLKSIPYVVLQ
jgi:hypothetical protein